MKEFSRFQFSRLSRGLLLIFSAAMFAFVPNAAGMDTCTTSNVCVGGYELLDGFENNPCETWEDGCTLTNCCVTASTGASFGDLNCDTAVDVIDIQLNIIVALGIPISEKLDVDQNGIPDACPDLAACGEGTSLNEAGTTCVPLVTQEELDAAVSAAVDAVDITADNDAVIAEAIADLFTQEELDAAVSAAVDAVDITTDNDAVIAEAIADLFTQEELDAAVSAAVAAVDITTDNDAVIAEAIADLFTQEELDAAVSAAVAAVDITTDNDAVIAEAIADLFTQEELDAAVSAAMAAVDITTDNDAVIAEAIADLFTQEELDAAVSAAVAAVDITTDNQSSYDDGYAAGAATALTCQNGGSAVCSCLAGYSGDLCETDIDDCAGDPCQNGGTCTDGVNSYTCVCATGYVGPNCVDDCAGDPCQNGGTCTDGVNSYTCVCATGYEGPNCEDAIPVCDGVLCFNGGFCVSENGQSTCLCAPGFGGTSCEDTIDCATITVPETVPELTPGTGRCSATGEVCSINDDCSETGFSVVSGDCYKSNQYTSDMCLYPVRIDTGGTPLSCNCNDSCPESGEMQSCNGTKYLEDSHYACPNGGWDWDGNEYYESLCNGAGGDWWCGNMSSNQLCRGMGPWNCEVDSDCDVSVPNVCEVCGNGIIDGAETCDDGNTNNFDGCSERCRVEGWCAALSDYTGMMEMEMGPDGFYRCGVPSDCPANYQGKEVICGLMAASSGDTIGDGYWAYAPVLSSQYAGCGGFQFQMGFGPSFYQNPGGSCGACVAEIEPSCGVQWQYYCSNFAESNCGSYCFDKLLPLSESGGIDWTKE